LSNEIRIRFSGFVIFASQLLSVVTGLVFTLLLTRNMNTSEYGVWTNVFDYTGYFMFLSSVLPFWATRFMARGKEGTVKTSVYGQLSIAVLSVLVYLPSIVLISNAIGTAAYLMIYLISGLYVFNFYMITVFEGVLRSMKPQVIGYGLLIEEVVKVFVALVLILGFNQLFLGAMLALVVSGLFQVLYYFRLLAGEFKQKINWGYLREWLKGSAAIVYNAAGGQLVSFVLILLFLYGGSNTRAFYQAAFTFTNVIGYSASLAFALYPKLLAKTCPTEDVEVSFGTVLMFAIPLSTITMVMSQSFLTILNISYGVAWPVLIALTIDTLVVLISQFYASCLMGAEAFDVEGRISLPQLVRSKIFKVFSINYVQAAIALPLAYFVLTLMPVAGSVQAVVYVISILIGVHVSTFVGLYLNMHGSIGLPVAWKSIAKYVLTSFFMGVVLFLLPNTSTLIFTLAKAIAGFAIYALLLLAVDKQARELLRLIWKEIKSTVQQLASKDNNLHVELVS
jgi:O-antigen/teichoic acid export membrane protein